MGFDKINRRTHLYLGLFLLPWLAMYGLSSLILIHQSRFQPEKPPAREVLFERPYARSLPTEGQNNEPELRAVAQEILKDIHLEGAFWVERPNRDTLHIERFTFRDSISVTYSIGAQKIKAERQLMRTSNVVLRLHFRGGYLQPDFANTLWGFVVDATCVAILLWVMSGLVMWWKLPRLRRWGGAAIAAGFLAFGLLLCTL